eukprot:3673739-Lingulodinium_polyedra.AAC.1
MRQRGRIRAAQPLLEAGPGGGRCPGPDLAGGPIAEVPRSRRGTLARRGCRSQRRRSRGPERRAGGVGDRRPTRPGARGGPG